MDRVIGVTELQRNFRAVFDEVAHRHLRFILTRGSRPEVVMISYDQYLQMAELTERGVLERFDRAMERLAAANAQVDEETMAADLEEARRQIRKRR